MGFESKSQKAKRFTCIDAFKPSSLDKCDAWFVNFGAIKHMSDRKEWVTNFVPILVGNWPLVITTNLKHWVEGIGNIFILTSIDGVIKSAIIAKVLYILNLKQNLFLFHQATGKGVTTLFNENTFTMIDKNNNGVTLLERCLDEKTY
jgi:hypothetical protein